MISYNQSAFIPDRIISDNVIIAYKPLHAIKNRQKGQEGSMAVKLDMSKVYDRVKWKYLRLVMEKIDFGGNWIDLIMKCVTSVHYSILINGLPGDEISPTIGLRQDDPLSLSLFLYVHKG